MEKQCRTSRVYQDSIIPLQIRTYKIHENAAVRRK
jgi:hypothetical protein